MNTLEQLRDGFHRVIDSVAEGWQHLRDRATGALTRFTPFTKENADKANEQAMWRGSRWGMMAADLEEDKNSIHVRLEAPGMEADDFDIMVMQKNLYIRGKKHAQREHKTGEYHIMECAYGSFERVIPLPAYVDETKTQAQYKRGILSISLPKTENTKQRRIKVEG